MILLDTETTDLMQSAAVDIKLQPHIVELAALKLDFETLEEIDRIQFRCKPPVPMTKESEKITGIKTEDLNIEKPFAGHYLDLVSFFLGETILVAHNLPFDRAVLSTELMRLGRLTKFPWPWDHICTAELTSDLNQNKYFKQEELYEHVTGSPANQKHRAMDDVEQLRRIVLWLRQQGRI